MKSYTDLNQSKRLAEILSLKSANMGWNVFIDGTTRILPIDDWDLVKDGSGNVKFHPAWSLAALMNVLDRGTLFITPQGWACQSYINFKAITSDYYSNPIDACYEIILKLNELNLL